MTSRVTKWSVELGDPIPDVTPNNDSVDIMECKDQPVVTRRNTRINLEWRIRNMPYPIDTYSIKANDEEKCVVVSTTNKKYYKKLHIPELVRLGLPVEQANVYSTHNFNTLVVVIFAPRHRTNICAHHTNICPGWGSKDIKEDEDTKSRIAFVDSSLKIIEKDEIVSSVEVSERGKVVSSKTEHHKEESVIESKEHDDLSSDASHAPSFKSEATERRDSSEASPKSKSKSFKKDDEVYEAVIVSLWGK